MSLPPPLLWLLLLLLLSPLLSLGPPAAAVLVLTDISLCPLFSRCGCLQEESYQSSLGSAVQTLDLHTELHEQSKLSLSVPSHALRFTLDTTANTSTGTLAAAGVGCLEFECEDKDICCQWVHAIQSHFEAELMAQAHPAHSNHHSYCHNEMI
mgnify:CR=1 FL=1